MTGRSQIIRRHGWQEILEQLYWRAQNGDASAQKVVIFIRNDPDALDELLKRLATGVVH